MSETLTIEEQAQYDALLAHINGKHSNSVPPHEAEQRALWTALTHAVAGGDELAAEYFRYALHLTSDQGVMLRALLSLDPARLPAAGGSAILESYQGVHVRVSRESWPHYARFVSNVASNPTHGSYAELRALYNASLSVALPAEAENSL